MKSKDATSVEVHRKELVTSSTLKFTLILDLSASRGRIRQDFAKILADIGAPYRDVDYRIFDAVDLVNRDGLSPKKASIRIFGSPHHAEKIRYWVNKLGACK